MYELKYIYKLEPVRASDAIERGLSYHEGVEHLLLEQQDYHHIKHVINNPKIDAMIFAFNTYVIPKILSHGNVSAVEKWFNYRTESGHIIVGRLDGILADGIPIEHKSTSGLVDGAYLQRLEFDEQINTYLLATESDKMLYTVCSVPTIRQKKTESDEEFAKRCFDWFDADSKISAFEIQRSWSDLDKFASEQDEIVTEMQNCKNFYRNPSHCMKYGRLCEYAPVCLNYDESQDYIQFKRGSNTDEKVGETAF